MARSPSLAVRVLAPLALVAGSLLLVAIALEAGLRLFWGGYYEKFDPDRPFGEYQFHPERALALIPSWEHVEDDREFRTTLRHNALGFRGPEMALAKPPDRMRVMLVGDSMTYGWGVEYEETYAAVLQTLAPEIQVINAGARGYSTGQQLLLLRERIEGLAPDLVVLAYFWNDVWETRKSRYPEFVLRDGRARLVPPDPATPEHPAFDHLWRRHERRAERYGWLTSGSHAYRFLSDRLKLLRYAIRDLAGEATEIDQDGHLALAEEAEAWELGFALLRDMRDLVHAHGARFAILVIPDQVQIEPDVTVYDVPAVLHHIQERVVAFAESEGIPVIEPLETLRALRARDGEPQYYRLDRHWNRVGHAHMGRVLHEELTARGLLEPPG